MNHSSFFFNRPLFSISPTRCSSDSLLPRVGDLLEFQFFSLGKEFGFFRGLVIAVRNSDTVVLYDGLHGIFFSFSLASPVLGWFTLLKSSSARQVKNISKFISLVC